MLFTADRWYVSSTSALSLTMTKQTATPPTGVLNYLRVTVNNSVAPGATQYSLLRYSMEGLDARNLHNKVITIGFWIRCNLSSTNMSVAIRSGDLLRAYVTNVAITAANTWEYKIVSLYVDTSTGTFVKDNTKGLEISFCIDAGSSLIISTDTWTTVSSSYGIATGVQTAYGTNSAVLDFANVQVNIGALPISFIRAGKTSAGELLACQRYFEKTYDVNTDPGTVTAVGCMHFSVASISTIRQHCFFRVTKRIAPTTVVVYSSGTGAAANWRKLQGATDYPITIAAAATGQNGFLGYPTSQAGVAEGDEFQYHYSVETEL